MNVAARELYLKKLQKVPYIIPLAIMVLSCLSFVLLYSAANKDLSIWASKQIIAFLICIPLTIFIILLDSRILYRFTYFFYWTNIILLILVKLIGKTAMGAQRWLDLKIITIQPSEMIKISLVMMLAKYFHSIGNSEITIKKLLLPLFGCLFPIVLVMKQPDLGTAMIMIIVSCFIFFAAGLRLIYFIISGIVTICSLPVIWMMLHNYQKSRILTFLHPESDPLGTGYNIIQSKIAIGSGALFGKGLFQGTQGHLRFLPEYQTDFIFAFLAEELGFVGGMFLLSIYTILIISCIGVAINCRAKYHKLLVIGITALFFSHMFINIAMVMGLLPVVGVPLPLISYGRTMFISMILGFALVLNAAVNQHKTI